MEVYKRNQEYARCVYRTCIFIVIKRDAICMSTSYTHSARDSCIAVEPERILRQACDTSPVVQQTLSGNRFVSKHGPFVAVPEVPHAHLLEPCVVPAIVCMKWPRATHLLRGSQCYCTTVITECDDHSNAIVNLLVEKLAHSSAVHVPFATPASPSSICDCQ